MIRQRPAETSAVALAAALLIARLAGVRDLDTVTAIGIVIGFVPAAVTWLVNLGRARRGVTVQVTERRPPPPAAPAP